MDSGNGLAITVWTFGATLVEVNVPDRHGRTDNVVVRLPDLRSYEDPALNAYVGATVGRYCRCVTGGRIELDGTVHVLDRNDDGHHLHGGSLGFDKHVWRAEPQAFADRLVLRLRLHSPDGDQGYPGALDAEVRYEVDAESRLTIEFRATTTASTVVGLTNHAFWNLGGAGRTVDDHELTLNSTRYVGFDERLMPLVGPPRPVAGTPLDHTTPRRLRDSRIDNFFVLDDPEWAAEVVHRPSGRAMRVLTDQSGVGVYSGDHFRRPRAGLCLETGAWPDAPNRPDFPSVRLDPGQTYRHRTIHQFQTIGDVHV
ncbi:aldose epimerase family protein [Streptomyces sp. NPDC090054]|uniref:aldose epimerase family protein n=1 Tax=Streptomyces sp. NPDC090054 TaxID=3365933 RepID=UPI003814139E